MSIFGKFTYKIDDALSSYILRYISSNRFPAEGIVTKGGCLFVTVPAELKKAFDEELDRLDAEYEIVKVSGAVRLFRFLTAKKGMLIGCLVSVIILNMLSGLIFSFEILTDDRKIKNDVMALLYQNGIKAGSYTDDINFTSAERALKQKVEGISWAGISVQGCKVIIDIVENVEKPEFTQRRLPTNLIARDSGVIDKVDIVDGQLMTTVGSGVKKGDVIVSGDVLGDLHYSRKGFVKHFYVHYYTRSIGKVYGSFERHETFFQPYTAAEKTITGEPERKRFLTLFDVDIPLFFEAESESLIGEYREEKLSFFGVDLPVGTKSTELTRYAYIERPISQAEAKYRASELAKTYENNFLGEFEIRSKNYSFEADQDGVYLHADYELYGIISEEVEFFISK